MIIWYAIDNDRCQDLFQCLLPGYVRSFIAIELTDEIKTVLSGLQQRLKRTGADIRWVKVDNIHLTLKFLGDIQEDSVSSVIDALKGACNNHNVFNVEMKGMGTFPAKKSPRVLWAGICDTGGLSSLQSDIDSSLASLGFAPEKRGFTPHLTLGRFRSANRNRNIQEQIEIIKHDSFGLFDVRSIYLMKSELKPSGAVYSRIAAFPLKTQGM